MTKKLKDMDYCEFMNHMCSVAYEVFDYNSCEKCGGTGAVAVMCCGGQECGCQGRPIDFELECKKCGMIYQGE